MSKEYLIRLPWPPKQTSPNGSRGDYQGKARAARDYKQQCAVACHRLNLTRADFGTAHVEITFHPPCNRRRDLDNMLAAIKQGLDAVSSAIGVDDSQWLRVTLIRGEKVSGGCVLCHIKAGG